MTLSWDGKQKEGEAEMAKAFAINESLVAKYPKDSVLRQGLLETFLQSSQLYEDADPAHSLEILLKARNLAEESIKSDPADIQARQNLAKTYSRLGVIALRLGRLEDTVAYLEKSSAAFSELEKIDPKHRTYKHDEGRVLMFLGQAKHQQRKFPEALATYAKAAAIFENITQADPQNNLPTRKLATVHTYIGDTHRDFAQLVTGKEHQMHLQAAKESYRRALDIYLRLQAQQALTEYDRKDMEEARTALLKSERE